MVRINKAELDATKAKLAKINDRAAKRGFTGLIDLAVERVEVTTTDDFGFQRTDVFFDVALSGEPPKFDGWTFLATLDWDQHAGLIVRTIPGVGEIDRDSLQEGWCDHCRTHRQRNNTFLVRHEDGRQVQVGSTCIKDFLGWNAGVVVLYADDVIEQLGFGGFGGQPDAVSTKYALAVAWALIKLDGYKPASNFGATTKGDVIDVLWPPRTMPLQRREELARIAVLADEAMVRAQECIDWVLNDMTGHGDYVKNLKAIVGADFVTMRNIGVLASAPQAWAKALHRTLIEKAATVSEWIGAAGDKVTFTAVVNDIRYVPGQFGPSIVLYTMQTPEGNVVKWFSSAGTLGDKVGETFTLKATIKALEEFRGVKQTLVTRAKILQPVGV
jgi:hypothetical protein